MLMPLIALAAAATPAADAANIPGIWFGTVGTLPVRACFTRRDDETFGAYYYLSQMRLIPLEAEEGSSVAFGETESEAPGTARWRIQSVDAGRLTAQWTSGQRSLPVRLTRVEYTEGEEGPCGSWVFHQPRFAEVRPVRSRAVTDGVAYTSIALDLGNRFEGSVRTFALDGSGETVQRINAELGDGLAGDPPKWFECLQLSLGYRPHEGYFDESLTPTMFTRRWLSVTDHWDGYCGGAHPDSSNAYRTFDLTSGREVDLYGWFSDAAVTRERVEGVEDVLTTVKPALRDLILAGWNAEDAECTDVVRDQDYWTVGLTRGGMVFSPQLPHVVQACGAEFTIPYARLRPFLTDQGAANIRALEAELAGRRAA